MGEGVSYLVIMGNLHQVIQVITSASSYNAYIKGLKGEAQQCKWGRGGGRGAGDGLV